MKKLINYLKDNEINLIASFLLPIIFSFVFYVNRFYWANAKLNDGMVSKIQEALSILWLVPLPIALLSLLGILLYKRGVHLEEMDVPNIFDSMIYFRLVTRGTNQQMVAKTVKNVIETMEAFNHEKGINIPYVMEVVTEKTELSLKDILMQTFWCTRLMVIELPEEYNTRNNATYKARALHYATEYSDAKENDWIFHLDDESQINQLTVLGILDFIAKEEKKLIYVPSYKPQIGQGTILYHRNLHKNIIYTLADSIRTADDLGRYFLQYLMKVCIFGMHGSFVLARNSIEKKEGFDMHPPYCITEDAYWGLTLMQKGYKFGHVYGFVHEQSPKKSLDFIKQRRRWFLGLTKVLQAPDISLRYKIMLIPSTMFWALSGFVVLYTALNIIHPVHIPLIVGVLSSLGFSIYVLMYTLGFYVNMKYARIPFYCKPILFISQIIFLPVFSILEATGAAYGVINRRLNFHVIRK